MNQGCNSAGAETDVLETEPDIDQHAGSCYHYRNDCFPSHFTADGGADGFCRNLLLIHAEAIRQGIIQLFSFRHIQCPGFENYLIGSLYLLGLHVSVAGNLLDHGNHIGIDILNGHIFIKGNVGGGTADELQAVVQALAGSSLVHTHKYEACNNQDDGNCKKYRFFGKEVHRLLFLCASVQLFVLHAHCIESIQNQSRYHQRREHGDHDTKSQCLRKALDRT